MPALPRLRPYPTIALLVVACAAPLAASGEPDNANIDPWQALSELRLHLAASGDLTATFEQSYVPAGFASGDAERGRLALALPDCLRWDYDDPYPKSYLLCGVRLHAWVRGEPQGQRSIVHAEEETGLDLLLLPVARLRERYRAVASIADAGQIEIRLEPVAVDAPLRDATFLFDPASQRPTALSYRDRDGNLTRFAFGEFGLLDDPAIFTPPPTLEWKEP